MPKQPSATSSTFKRTSIVRRVLLLVFLFIVAGIVAYPLPANKMIVKVNNALHWNIPVIKTPFVLGLDLQGGTRLEYSADVSKVDVSQQSAALEGVRDVIERRVNSIGLSEPLVQTAKAGNEWRVSVELAGIRDVNQAIKLIGETPILEFKEQNTEPPRKMTAEEKKNMDAKNAAADKAAQEALAQAQKNPTGFEALVASTTQKADTKEKAGDLGFIKDTTEYAEIFDAVKADKAGMIHNGVISMTGYDVVAKIEETKDAGIEINASHILVSFAGATNSTSTVSKEEARKKLEEIRKQVTAKNFSEMAKKYSQEPGAAEGAGALGWFAKGAMVPAFEDAAFKLKKGEISDIVETQFGYHLIYKSDERPLQDVHVRATFFKKLQESDIVPPPEQFKNTELTGRNLKRSQLDFDQRSGTAQVSLVFDDQGTKLFGEITKRNVGKPLAIYLDGQVISAPTVSTEISTGQAVINGNFSVQEAKVLAQRLNAGALPIPITLIAQSSVGPTLGQDSVSASLIAGLWGFLFVAVFMLVLYRLPGLMAIVALGLYVALSMTIFKVLPVTLTLSGIAGFILSIGIAVDANVLIFERLKEELHSGKTLKTALEEAFKRAWPSIRDGNFTTLISCAVLYWFTSSVIKGFALTLAIGVLLSMFSAIMATRTVLRYLAGFEWIQNRPWLFPGKKKEENI